MGDPRGPMQKGTMYMVLPVMHPLNNFFNFARIFRGSSQLLVGPASSFP